MRNPVIQTSNLSKSYDGKIVLDKIDFTLKQGEIYGLLGRNGAGKTTFIKAILGLTAMDSGEVKILSEKLSGDFSKDLLSQIGVVLDSASFNPTTCNACSICFSEIPLNLAKIERFSGPVKLG